MKLHFEVGTIDVNENTSAWGPHRFNLRPQLPNPNGDPIKTVVVSSFLDGEESTDELIAKFKLVEGSTNMVDVWFNWPGTDFIGQHVLQFNVTLESEGTNSFYYGYVDAQLEVVVRSEPDPSP